MDKNKALFWLFFVGIFFPTSLSMEIGSIRLTLYRVALILFFVTSVSGIVKLCKPSLKNPAYLLFLYPIWAALALIVNHGLFDKLETSGIYFIEVLGPFAITVLYCNSLERIKKVITVYVVCVSLTLLITIPETLTNINWVQKILGVHHHGGINPRMGLYRSYGTFDHPILQGVFASTAISLAWFMGRYPFFIGAIVATITSVSSGAILSVFIQFMIIAWERFSRAVNNRWMVLLTLVIVFYFSIEIISNRSAMKAILTNLTLSSHTAYWRMTIWEFGMQNVWGSPFFGIGFHDWVRPYWMYSGSVDAFWLVSMMRYGLPAFIMYAGAFLIVIFKLFKLKVEDKKLVLIRRGWLTGMIGLALSSCTVHLWNNSLIFINFYLGLGAAILTVFSQELREQKSVNKREQA